MVRPGLPKVGERISVSKLYVSKRNVNYGLPFGESKEDRKLIANIRASKKIVEPFAVRPEDKDGCWKPGMDLDLAVGFGVYKGRRRFLGAKQVGFKEFTVGLDCLVQEVTDEEAEEASWTENFSEFRKGMNPITRAKSLNKIVSRHGIRGYAALSGIPASSLSEYLTVLNLTPKMQDVVAKGLLSFSQGMRVARMKLGEGLQDELAGVLETEGLEAFNRALARAAGPGMKRGIPKDVYEIDRMVWDKRNRKLMGYYEIIGKAAKAKGFEKIPEYEQDFLIRHIDEIKREGEAA